MFFPEVMRSGLGLDHSPHLAPRLKKEYSYTSTPPLCLRGLFLGEIYLYLYLPYDLFVLYLAAGCCSCCLLTKTLVRKLGDLTPMISRSDTILNQMRQFLILTTHISSIDGNFHQTTTRTPKKHFSLNILRQISVCFPCLPILI
jgi:hypothetical protein